MKLRHAGTEFYALDGNPARPEDHWYVLAYLHRKAVAPLVPDDVHRVAAASELFRIQTEPRPVGVKAITYINHGRWLANCPDPTCNGAELIHLDNPAFFCGSCLNAKWGGALLDVEMPNPAFIQPILDLLELRVDTRLQQWQPGWTIEQVQDLHLSFTTPYTWTTGEVVTAAKLNTSAGRDNESALDATFDRLLAQIAISSTATGVAGVTVLESVVLTVNNGSDKVLALAGYVQTGAGAGDFHIRDNTDGVNGPVFVATSDVVTAHSVAALFTNPSVGSHTIEFRSDGVAVGNRWLLAWVIPNNV